MQPWASWTRYYSQSLTPPRPRGTSRLDSLEENPVKFDAGVDFEWALLPTSTYTPPDLKDAVGDDVIYYETWWQAKRCART